MSTLLTKLTADFSTQLASALSVGGTTATLLSQTDDDGNTIPDGNYSFTLDGASSNKEHIRCVKTGLNLTSIQSLSRQGALTTGVVRAHRIGTSVVITDWAQLKYLTDILTGDTDLDASNPLRYDGTATLSNDADLATKKYVDDTAIAGSPKATDSVYGITKLSVAAVSGTDPIAVGTNDTRMPTQDENNALVGTSGTPSTSNKYVTNDDTAENTASKLVRRKSDSNVTVPTTPTAGTDAVSKTYSDLNISGYKSGNTTYDLSTASGTQTIAHGLGKTPKYIRITYRKSYTNQALGSSTVNFYDGVGTFNGTTYANTYNGTDSSSAGGAGFYSTFQSTSNIIVYTAGGGGSTVTQVATAAIDTTNITLTWTKTLSPTGTLLMTWEAFA